MTRECESQRWVEDGFHYVTHVIHGHEGGTGGEREDRKGDLSTLHGRRE